MYVQCMCKYSVWEYVYVLACVNVFGSGCVYQAQFVCVHLWVQINFY